MPGEFFSEIIECLKMQAESRRTVAVAAPVLAAWQAAAGIPHPEPPVRPRPTAGVAAPPVSSLPAASGAEPPVERRQSAVDALDFAALTACALACRECRLCEQRSHVVFGEGDPAADLMFVGEGPGAEEDAQGRPFVGEAGQLLDKMIAAMQFSRETVYIANIVKCRPPGNRNPADDEAAACLKYLRRQIALIQPRVIVTLGAVPLRFLLEANGITRSRGKWMEYRGIPVMPTFHPAYLLRNPAAKREVWSDLQQVMARFGKQPPPRR